MVRPKRMMHPFEQVGPRISRRFTGCCRPSSDDDLRPVRIRPKRSDDAGNPGCAMDVKSDTSVTGQQDPAALADALRRVVGVFVGAVRGEAGTPGSDAGRDTRPPGRQGSDDHRLDYMLQSSRSGRLGPCAGPRRLRARRIATTYPHRARASAGAARARCRRAGPRRAPPDRGRPGRNGRTGTACGADRRLRPRPRASGSVHRRSRNNRWNVDGERQAATGAATRATRGGRSLSGVVGASTRTTVRRKRAGFDRHLRADVASAVRATP